MNPRPESELDRRCDYHWAVLSAALDAMKGEGAYILRDADFTMSEIRALEELIAASGKVTVIRNDMQARVSQVSTLNELKMFSIGAGRGLNPWDWIHGLFMKSVIPISGGFPFRIARSFGWNILLRKRKQADYRAGP